MVNSLLKAALAGLFPDYCALCGLRSCRALPLCQACEQDLQPNSSCCYRCAIPLPTPRPPATGTLCGKCLQAPPPFDRVIAPWLYCELMAHLILRWKFHAERRLSPLLATLWLRNLEETPAVDILVPVPLHWRRLWGRGFNQSELLCRQLHSISPVVGMAQLDHLSVRRNRATQAQSGIKAKQRSANLKGAFTAIKRYDNLRVAIVDDVFTTGATAAELAAILRSAGADHVEVWCLARTPGPGY
jgi:ComF family protein